MTHPITVVRRRRTTTIAVASFATALTALTGGVGGATAAEPPVPGLACTPFDADSNVENAAVSGMAVTGLTVSNGTTPDAFSGTVLGVIDDGIAPGLDMIMARLTSPEIDRVGIWAGMSGSPVYTPDGHLLGAVAYSLAFGPTTVAGITPAGAMVDVANGATAPRSARTVKIPARLQRKIVARTSATPRAAGSGLSALRTPVGVSGGASDKRLKKVKRRFDLTNVKMYRAAPAPAAPGEPGTIVPGGNLGVSLAYGDVSLTASGTVTAVCGDTVLGFGHPFTFNGETALTMQSMNTLYVQEDPIFSGFKVANATGPVGTISQDRLAGVAGPLGPIPDTTTVTSNASADDDGDGVIDTTGTSTSFASGQEFVPDVTFLQTLLLQDRVFDRFSGGSGRGHFVINGSSVEGGPFTLDRRNRYANRFDLSFEMALEAPIALFNLSDNRFTDFTIDDVTVDSVMNPEARLFRVDRVERKVGGDWTRIGNFDRIRTRAGDTLKFRVHMTSFRDRFGSKTAKVQVDVPARIRGRASGFLGIQGGDARFFFGSGGADSFNELVQNLENAPRNDELLTSLSVRARRSPRINREMTQPVGDVVTGGKFFQLSIRG